MNQAIDLIAECARAGIALAADGDRIVIDGPASAVPDDLVEKIRARKPELMRALVSRWNPELAADSYVWCLDCRHWSGTACRHPDNAFREQQPLAPRKCRWYAPHE